MRSMWTFHVSTLLIHSALGGGASAMEFPWIINGSRLHDTPPYNNNHPIAKSGARVLEPEVTVNHSSKAWNGLHWHYRVPSESEKGKHDEWTVYLIEHDSPEDDEDMVATAAILARRDDFEAKREALHRLDGRANICEIIIGCLDHAAYYGQMTVDQVNSVATSIDTFLTNDKHKKLKYVLDKVVVSVTVGIVTSLVWYYVQLKWQGSGSQNSNGSKKSDSCNSEDLEAAKQQLLDNWRNYASAINSSPDGKSVGAMYAWCTVDNTVNPPKVGECLFNTVTRNEDENNLKSISQCLSA